MKFGPRFPAIIFLLLLIAGLSYAQHAAEQPRQRDSQGGVEQQLSEASQQAAGHEEGGHAEFKQSPSVKWVASLTGLDAKSAYWVLLTLNFLIIAALIFLFTKSSVPAMFRARTESIRKGMDEARRASEDANHRLSEIEARLKKLDAEIGQMRAAAEAEAASEEQRIVAGAEEEKRKIVQSAEQEIAAAAKLARRDLKAYAAELAVALAEKRIHVDASTDQALVRSFVEQLGKDGR